MSKPTRFDPVLEYGECYEEEQYATMRECSWGSYVTLEDYR